ncbi:MAG: HNH endonuclease [Verrucomicrobia bacterium]|nr:HNH endonuclease [Verrucomicrobiota bacterium]
MNIESAIERLYNLKIGVTGVGGERHERPHKPLLLLAVFDLMDEGLATPDHIPWCRALRDRFTRRFLIVRKRDDRDTPDNPFRYLQGDGFWEAREVGDGAVLRRNPLVGEFDRVVARFTDGFDVVASIPANRRRMREALVARYFPGLAAELLAAVPSPAPERVAAEEELEYGRSPAFRRKIVEVYDHQCAACGLRIRLPGVEGVSFIDAAHLVPFAESRNDHPTNGMALCKNHHWAMDRRLIAPCEDGIWHISGTLDRRRSTGEAELVGLRGQPILMPQESAFQPSKEALRWRCERLIA